MSSHVLNGSSKEFGLLFGCQILVDIMIVMRHSHILSCLFLRGYIWHFSHYVAIICIKTMEFTTENRTEKNTESGFRKNRDGKILYGATNVGDKKELR